MKALEPVTHAVNALARRLLGSDDATHEADDRPGLTPLIDITAALGSALHDPDTEGLHRILPSLALLRETLENGGGIEQTPWEALSGDKSEPFAAGSLWALSTVINAVLDEEFAARRRERDRANRADVRDVILGLFAQRRVVSSGDIAAAVEARGQSVARPTVSKAVGDLLEAGLIDSASAPPNSDRRHRWYQRAVTARPA